MTLTPEGLSDEHRCISARCADRKHHQCGRHCVYCGEPCICDCGHTGRPPRKYKAAT